MKALDLIITNALIADVVRLRAYRGWVGVANGVFQYVEPGDAPRDATAAERVDAGGQLVAPGLIDAHMHIESSLATPRRFAEAALPHGTTAVLADPHELANVLGASGVHYQIAASRDVPLRVFTAIPSCVPATDDTLETALGTMTAADVDALAREPGVIALGELMDYQGLAGGSARLEGLISAARRAHLLLEGHTPTFGGLPLSDYAAHGITSDHTLSTPAKLDEQLTKGFTVMLQEKSLNAEVIDAVRALPDRSRVLLVTDDVMPNRLVTGHLSRLVTLAARLGLAPMEALASATARPAAYLRRPELGLIAPGRAADFVLLDAAFLDGRADFRADAVFVAGREVARDGRATFPLPAATPAPAGGDVRRAAFTADDARFDVPDGERDTNVIVMNDANTFTRLERRRVRFTGGAIHDADAVAVGVFLRQGGAGALGVLGGLGLRAGAFASSLAHDSHNLVVVGRDPDDMRRALNLVLDAGGGMAFTRGGEDVVLPLPVAGLVSDEPVPVTAERFDRIETALRAEGVTHRNPVLFLTLLALTVSPGFKMSDRGLVDVEARALIPVFA